jgi:hypothetical protein
MTIKAVPSLAITSLLLSASSLLLATISIVLGRQVNYLAYLSLFNAMAVGWLSLGAAALVVALVGTWKAQGRSTLLWVANAVAVFVVVLMFAD